MAEPILSFNTVSGSKGRKIRLQRDAEYDVGFGNTIKVPAGYETDGASIPKIAWFIIGPPIGGPYFTAAVLHDYLCDLAHMDNSYRKRLLADACFFYRMAEDGVAWWRRMAMFLAVEYYGRISYLFLRKKRVNLKP